MRALFDDPAAVQEDDAIGALNRPQPMRDQHHRPARHQALDALVDGRLVHRIQRRGHLVQQHDGRILQQRSRDRNPLALTAGQQCAAHADMRRPAAGQSLDHLVQARRGRGRPHVGVIGIGTAEPHSATANTTGILATGLDPTRFPAGVYAGIGPADRPDRSWREARTALRFTSPRQPIVHYDDLGASALLAHVPQTVVRDNADVAAIARLASTPEDLETLDVYCATSSLRRAAELLHLHHSSVSRRIDQMGRALGIDLTDPTGLFRARIALATWRLLDG